MTGCGMRFVLHLLQQACCSPVASGQVYREGIVTGTKTPILTHLEEKKRAVLLFIWIAFIAEACFVPTKPQSVNPDK